MRKKKWNELIIALTVSMVVCGCGKNQETDSVSVGMVVNGWHCEVLEVESCWCRIVLICYGKTIGN